MNNCSRFVIHYSLLVTHSLLLILHFHPSLHFSFLILRAPFILHYSLFLAVRRKQCPTVAVPRPALRQNQVENEQPPARTLLYVGFGGEFPRLWALLPAHVP
jgi:hypothetical protein